MEDAGVSVVIRLLQAQLPNLHRPVCCYTAFFLLQTALPAFSSQLAPTILEWFRIVEDGFRSCKSPVVKLMACSILGTCLSSGPISDVLGLETVEETVSVSGIVKPSSISDVSP